MKHIAKQIEVKFDAPESFRLVVKSTTDGDRVAHDGDNSNAE